MTLLADHPRKVSHGLSPIFVAWNNDPNGGGWCGYSAIEAQMRAGEHMAEGVCVDPRTPAQYAAYHRLQNLAPLLHYERRPPAQHGLGCLHLHFERSDHGDIDGADTEEDVA